MNEDRIKSKRVTVEIPELGAVTLEARECGSVYRETIEGGQGRVVRLDEDGMLPTKGL